MKHSLRITLTGISLSACCLAQAAEPQISERGPNHRVWERTIEERMPDGQAQALKSSYTEIAVGMHYLKDGQWIESKEEIELFQDGAVARQGQLQAVFANNIATHGAIDVLFPDGKRFRTHVLGIAFYDRSTGKSELIAEVKDSFGELHPPNVIVYPDAFSSASGARGAIRFTYSKDRLEQDIVLFNKLDLPQGFDPASSQIEVWTEAVDFEEPEKSVRQIDELIDETLIFGAIRIGQGLAFTLQDPQGFTWSASVCKQWVKADAGRTFLIEASPYLAIKDQLDALPPPGQGAALRRAPAAQQLAALKPGQRTFPAMPKSAKVGKIQTAALNDPASALTQLASTKALVIDYSLVITASDQTFKGDSTYYVSSAATLTGTTVFEGGAVIKCTNANNASARLTIQGPIDCKADAYRPIILTGKDDDLVGETISGSTGNPATNYYGKYIDLAGNTNPLDLHDIRIRHAYYGINMDSAVSLTFTHSQLSSNWAAIVNSSGGQAWLRNVLIHDGTHTFGSSGTNRGENVTFHRLTNFRSSGYTNTWLTNSLIMSVTNNVSYTGVCVVSNRDDTGIFQTVGAGARYLANQSTNRNAGTTNINPTLLADIKQRTTYPPLVLTDNIVTDTTLYLQAGRDTDTPDLGYHFDSLDYCWSGLTLSNATLRLANGVAVAVYGTNGIWLENGAKFISEGSPTARNRLVRYQAVQEEPGPWGATAGTMSLFSAVSTMTLPEVRFRFTDVSLLADAFSKRHVIADLTSYIIGTLELKDSTLCGGYFDVRPYASSALTQTIGFTNSLLLRGGYGFVAGYYTSSPPVVMHLRNNLVKDCVLSLNNRTNTTTWTAHDNFFDTVTLSGPGTPFGVLVNTHNGYLSTTALSGATNTKTVPYADYQTGPLGSYYYPTNGTNLAILLGAGSRNADTAGLWHFTVTTNQVAETNSVVDIGMHFVAVNSSNQAIDTDSDGSADYFEDLDGDGVVDSSETDWNNSTDLGLRVVITRPKNGGNIP